MITRVTEVEVKVATQASSTRGALVGLSLAMLLSSLGTSIANVALPTLALSFSATFQDLQWVVLSYLLAVTMLIVSVGRLGDMLGRRRLLLAGLILFTGSSILGGVAPTLWWLIAARGAQGLGAAIMMSLAIAFIGETVPKERTGSAMGLLGSMSAIGTALGPSLGGLLISGLGWRSIFFVNLPLGILALVYVYRYLPVDSRREYSVRNGFDYSGTLVMAGTLASYALAMTLGSGDFGILNLVLLLSAFLGASIFLVVEGRSAWPLIQIRLFRDREFSLSLGMSAIVSTVLMTTLVVGPFYLSRALALNTATVGTLMSVGPSVVILAGLPFGRLVDRFGARRMTITGLFGVAIGSLALAVLPSSTGIPGYVVPIVIVTMGYALFQTANNTSVMKEVAQEQRGLISGLLNLSRNLGLITGASAMGAVFALTSGVSSAAVSNPESVAEGFRMTFVVATVLVVALLAVAAKGKAVADSLVAEGDQAS